MSTVKTGPKPKPVSERFWRKVRRTSTCWLWSGSLLPKGYGKFGVAGGAWRLAHRVAWELEHGPIPSSTHVLHKCDNPRCVRVSHLFVGTNRDNIADRVQKGRTPRGERHWRSMLTAASVKAIRSACARGVLQAVLAERYGTTQGHISAIVRRKLWKHIA